MGGTPVMRTIMMWNPQVLECAGYRGKDKFLLRAVHAVNVSRCAFTRDAHGCSWTSAVSGPSPPECIRFNVRIRRADESVMPPELFTSALLPLIACLANALCALAIWLRDPTQRTNQLSTALVGLAAWWGFCQVQWSTTSDAGTAYLWHHLAAPGWAFIGPLALHLVVQRSSNSRAAITAMPTRCWSRRDRARLLSGSPARPEFLPM